MANWTPVSIANLALASMGSTPIQSFDDATPAGSNCKMFYPLVMRGLFAEYPWAFARDTRPLNSLNMTELPDGALPSGWRYAYALPADMIGPPEKFLANRRLPDRPETHFEVQNQIVYSDQSALWVVAMFYVDEASWPDYFVTAAVACLTAEIYPFITGNGPRLPNLQQTAWGLPSDNRRGGKLGVAMRADARNNPSRILSRNPLIDVRGGGTQDVWSNGPGGA